MTEQFDVAVVGAGPAGIAAALRAAELGASVVLIERADHVGGTCVNTGCVPTRALAKAARLMREIRAAGAYG
ncbi:FAD-dependent oxidoreductase, partial [Microbacterium aurantiacum]